MFTIDWSAFTPVPSAVGGVLIGAAAAALALGGGKIAGVSGIVGGALADALAARAQTTWRLQFVLGIVLAAVLWSLWGSIPGTFTHTSWLVWAIGGWLVGAGSRLGSGCASGHGVCGLARLSPRSFAAVATFTATAIATAVAVHRLLH
ncbi:MAG: YeeE/YedE family protein [Thiomonas sp.]|jgi:uncharacterized membrane protein YedE/YeeE